MTDIEIPESVEFIEMGAFKDCSKLKNVKMHSGELYWIGAWAFMNCTSLTDIELPEGVIVMGERSFAGCSNLQNLTLASSVGSDGVGIGEYACEGCPKTMVVYAKIGSYAEQWAKENNFILKIIEESEKETPILPSDPPTQDEPVQPVNPSNPPTDTPVAVPYGEGSIILFSDYKLQVTSSDKTNPTVECIGLENKSVKKVKIPDAVTIEGITYKVTAVADNAFSGNKKITAVTIGRNVTAIGKNVFKNCKNLKTVDIKSTTLNKIGANAFNGANKLTKITLKTTKLTKKSVGKNALKGTNKKLVIKVPKKLVKKYKTYFKGKGNKTVKVM